MLEPNYNVGEGWSQLLGKTDRTAQMWHCYATRTTLRFFLAQCMLQDIYPYTLRRAFFFMVASSRRRSALTSE